MKKSSHLSRYLDIVWGCSGDLAVGATGYLPCQSNMSQMATVQAADINYEAIFLVVRPGYIRNLVAHAETPPGAGESVVYTLRLNGVNTALTCTVSGAVDRDASDLVNIVAVTPGDIVTLQVVNSVGGAASLHAASAAFNG